MLVTTVIIASDRFFVKGSLFLLSSPTDPTHHTGTGYQETLVVRKWGLGGRVNIETSG